MMPMRTRHALFLAVLGAATPALAQTSPPADDSDVVVDIPVISRRLDAQRQQIQPSLGASSYNFGPQSLDTLPQGADAPLSDVLVHAPGVALDSFGQIHLRGEHANVQYRLDGVELPEGLSVFGQAIAARFADKLTLNTGALPAQYGFETAGVVDIQTKSGINNPGLTVGVTGGSWNWAQPSIEYGGQSGPVDWFFTGDYLHNNRGIENPTASFNALHDTTDQFHGLGHISVVLDPQTRLSLLLGGFDGRFQIPNNPGQPTLGFPVNGVSNFNSAALNEKQRERTEFGILSLQKHVGALDLQVSAYVRDSAVNFTPDPLGDLLFTGIAQQASRTTTAVGTQTDASWQVNDAHTLRMGFLAQQATTGARTLSQVLPVDASGNPTSDAPLNISSSFLKAGSLYGLYLQDEWRILPHVTVNAGLRFDAVDEFTHENQLSPRLNVVWQATPDTTLHVGYARYFVPPPFELVSAGTISQFLNTTAAPSVTADDPVRAERSHYFDLGVSHVLAPGLTVGVDAYYKIAHNLIDEGQFGAPIILAAFNYAKGTQQGVEFTTSYDRGPWSLYANAAWSRAMGQTITSAQFNFGPDELSYIANNPIHLDHDQTWSGSAGAAYSWNADSDTPTRLSADIIVQSGLRASIAGGVPNGIELPTYAPVNLALMHKLRPGTMVRLDVLNVGDEVYQIRNGTGVGVGAPQYGMRRTILASLSQHF